MITKKIYVTIILIVLTLTVIGTSYAIFVTRDTRGNLGNKISGHTITYTDLIKDIRVEYDSGNGIINTDDMDLSSNYSSFMKFKVFNAYEDSINILINLDLVSSTLSESGTSYELYACSESVYVSTTANNAATNCTLLSPETYNYFPDDGKYKSLHTTDSLSISTNSYNYYAAIFNINSSNDGNFFQGAIDIVEKTEKKDYHKLTLNLMGGNYSKNIVYHLKHGETLTLLEPTNNSSIFDSWSVQSGDGVLGANNLFTMGNDNTIVVANWS